MVHLSLKHRVKLGRTATLLSETSDDGPHMPLLGLSAAIAMFNILFFIAGAVMAGILDYSWYSNPRPGESSAWHKDPSIEAQKM